MAKVNSFQRVFLKDDFLKVNIKIALKARDEGSNA